jgi:hypothetical protein
MLCGATTQDVVASMVRWKGDTYGHGPRCRDVWSCYQNVKRQGEDWLLADTPRRPVEVEYQPW